LELRTPSVPTKEMEDEYIDFLAEDLRSDPWLTPRYKKFMAGPKRIPWKNHREIRKQYQFTFFTHWVLGSVLAWPLACIVGRRMKVYQGGVPIVPYQRFIHDFPNLEPAHRARKTFRNWSLATTVALGFVFARYTVNQEQVLNPWYTRPDLKPFAAMVKNEADVTEHTMKLNHYNSYKSKLAGEERKRSAWYRYFFTKDADFTVKGNPYVENNKADVYNPSNNFYNTHTNKFRDHLQN